MGTHSYPLRFTIVMGCLEQVSALNAHGVSWALTTTQARLRNAHRLLEVVWLQLPAVSLVISKVLFGSLDTPLPVGISWVDITHGHIMGGNSPWVHVG